ncbi:hypothetical protein BH11PSE6_BH11PSE6_03240 [soil metagenome]
MSYAKPFRSLAPLMLGVIFPTVVIAIEWFSGLCANSFFDPLPTLGHLVLVFAVPVINLLLLRAVDREEDPGGRLVVAGGAALAISGSYALIFLPILPIAVLAIILGGLGFLPFAPAIAGIVTFRKLVALSAYGDRVGQRAVAGFALGLALLFIVDLPATATRLALDGYRGDAAAQGRSVRLMRTFGDREALLRMSYGENVRATGLVSGFVSIWSNGLFTNDGTESTAARELYYRVTGTAFNAVERPTDRGDRYRLFGWDEDQGGEIVGGRVPGLSLAGSRIDGSVAAADNLAYVEWTMAIANRGALPGEGRFTLALPEGAVASRATLWVNGEPREASIAGRGEARAAYESVVRATRDPLLVTTAGAQRLLVQAFPIPAGGSLKLRIGYTAPFAIASDGKRSLALPAIVERNFDIASMLRHNVWVEGDAPLASATAALRGSGATLKGGLTDADLLAHRPRLSLPSLAGPSIRVGGVAAAGKSPPLTVVQTVAHTNPVRPSVLMIVLDGSVGNRTAGEALGKALQVIPSGVSVGLAIASEAPITIAPAPWSPAHGKRVAEAIAATVFRGGQDNSPALAAALAALPVSNAQLLWVHGPQPVTVAGAQQQIEQQIERSPTLPALVRYQAEPGRAFTIDGARWFDTARLVSPSGDPQFDLTRTLSAMVGAAPSWTVKREEAPGAAVTGSANIVRLWAADRIAAESGATGKQRDSAIGLAHRLNLITPVSGAVVLETDQDYKNNGLPVPSAEDVPTVPEPGEWALLAAVALAGFWLFRHRQIRALV